MKSLTIKVEGAAGSGKTTLLAFIVDCVARKFDHIVINHKPGKHEATISNWKHRKTNK